MNLAGIESALYERLGFTAAPPAVVTARLRAYINQTQREILSMKGLSSLRFAVLPCFSVATDPYMVLPQAAIRVLSLADRASQIRLQAIQQSDIRDMDPGQITTAGQPYAYAVVNLSAATAVAAPLTGLSFKSTAAGDGATKSVFIEWVSNGFYQTVSAPMNGITAVSFGLNTVGAPITKFYIALGAGGATTAAGNIMLTDGATATGTVLATIPNGRSFSRYTKLQLYPTPSAIVAYHADVELHIEDMAQAGDEPYLPEDFAWLLTSGALMKEWQRMEKTGQYDREKVMYKSGLGDLKMFVANAEQGDDPLAWRYRLRRSMLSPWFPQGS